MSTESAIAPTINPTAEDAYWREAFRREPYFRADLSYDDYSPAYRVGYTAPVRRRGEWEELEQDLEKDFQQVRGRSRLRWDEARAAVRAAWRRARAGEHPQ
ncbi:MAG TPA: hypothetical protein VHL79_23725 [Ramlibacter sp.]|jgi:hypothetical protein|nr:hypothetical protein [Ramlibacter sp.]